MSQYFIQTRTGQEGPFTLEELSKTTIKPDTLVWCKGMADWTRVGEIDAFSSLFTGRAILTSEKPFAVSNYQDRKVAGTANSTNEIFTAPKYVDRKDSRTAIPANEPFTTPAYDKQKSSFKLSLIHWTGIGMLVIAGFIYFARPGDAKSTTSDNKVPAVDSAAIEEAREVTEKKKVMSELAAKNINYRNNWRSYIKTNTSNFKTNTFGGIYKLGAIVHNSTDYPLEEVSIAVHYIKENGGTHKTEMVTLYNVPAHGKASVPAPDSNRGKSVKLEIRRIKAKRMNFSYSPDISVEGRDDPYYKVN